MNTLEPVLEAVGRILTDQYGINIVCEGQRCATDGRTIYLPALPDDVPDDLWRSIRGFIDHEASHLIFRSNFKIGNEFRKKHGGQAFGLLNVLEDVRVEEAMKQRFPGSGANLEHAYRAAEQSAQEKSEAGETIPVMRQLAFAATARAQRRPAPAFVDSAIAALAAQIDDEIMGSIHAPDTKTVATLTESAWTTVSSYLKSLPSADGQAQDGNSTQNGGNTASGNGPAQSGCSAASGGGASQKPSSTPSGEPSTSPPALSKQTSVRHDASANGKRRRTKSRNDNAHGATPTGNTANDSAGVTGVGASGATDEAADSGIIGGLGEDLAGAIQRHADTSGAYRVWSAAHDVVTIVKDASNGTHAYRLAPVMRHVAGVRQKLLQTLQAEVRARWRPDTDDGTLNPRALYRLAAARYAADQPEATSALTRCVFRQRVKVKRLKTAVLLLLDVSHSMSNRKLALAKDTALVLCEALDRLGLPTAVWTFSTEHHGKLLRGTAQATGIPTETLEAQYRFAPLIHERYKDFGEPFCRISGRFDQLRTHLMTPLGESLLFAARELARRPEPRRVLLCLTDGRPTVGMDNDIRTHNHAIDSIRRIERAGINVALVGILERCVLDLHHRAVVVDQLDDLPRTVMNQLHGMLSRDSRTILRHAIASAATA